VLFFSRRGHHVGQRVDGGFHPSIDAGRLGCHPGGCIDIGCSQDSVSGDGFSDGACFYTGKGNGFTGHIGSALVRNRLA
jgi:hypothetical protein